MNRDGTIKSVREALPVEMHGIKLTVIAAEERPEIEVGDCRTNERAALFFMSDIIADLDSLNKKHPNTYKEYVVAIESIRPNFVRYGKKIFKQWFCSSVGRAVG